MPLEQKVLIPVLGNLIAGCRQGIWLSEPDRKGRKSPTFLSPVDYHYKI